MENHKLKTLLQTRNDLQEASFQRNLAERKEAVDQFVDQYLDSIQLDQLTGLEELKSSFAYSLKRGGKRFRPVLSLLVGDAFAIHPSKILPFATAVEMIHTYSLIHDDLPCMDNDDFRRGEPTNHKVFGETTALLAGDALLTESFSLIANSYSQQPAIAVALIKLVTEASGLHGMVGGQAVDMKAKGQLPNQQNLAHMHAMKTGALIRLSCQGVAIIAGIPDNKVSLVRNFGANLGFAFQLADDLLDSTEGKIEKGSFPDLVGIEGTKKLLIEVSEKARKNLRDLGIANGDLHQLIDYNVHREK